jgi:ribose transport system substrate-binding protein
MKARGSEAMRGKKITIVPIVILTILTVFNGCYKRQSNNASNERKTIDFIVKMKGGEYWNMVKQGVNEAASEFDVNVNFIAPDDEQDIYQQEKLVNLAIERKVDAIVLAATDYLGMVEVTEKAAKNKIPVIIIDSSVNTDKVSSKVSTDNLEAGKIAGERLVELIGENSKVAIISFVKGSESAQKREEGVMSAFSKHKGINVVAKEYCYSSERLAMSQTKTILNLNPGLDGIVALNSSASIGAAEAIEALGLEGKVKLITFDSTLMGIQYLEKGIIQATVVQNPVAMGYLGVKYALMAATGSKIPSNVEVTSKLIDKNNMYVPENQKIIFPFIK